MENISDFHRVNDSNASYYVEGTTKNSPNAAPDYLIITATVFYILIFIVGLVGNILVITVVTCSRAMKTSINLYLVNLCVADILVILVCMPTALTDIYAKDAWYFGEAMCKVVPFLENTVANASVLTILAISIERYRVVCYPLKGMNNTTMKVLKIVVAIWIAALTTSAPWMSIPTLKKSKYPDGSPVTVCRNPIKYPWQNVYVVVLVVLFFVLPCILLFVLNCHLCRVLQRSQQNDPCIPGDQNLNERKRRRHQVVNIIASIVSIFFVCHLPFRVVFLWYSFGDKHFIYNLGLEFNLAVIYSARIMFYLNHAINPVVYNFVSTKFRTALREICHRSSYASSGYSNTRSRRNDSQYLCLNNVRSTPPTPNNKCRIMAGSNMCTYNGGRNESNYRRNERTTRISNDNSNTSSVKDYDVKIFVEDKTVAIKFNLKGQGKK